MSRGNDSSFSRREMIRDDLYLSQEQKDDIIKNMQHNTIEYTAILSDCNRHSLMCGERQVKTIFVVTGGEEENESVNMFCSKIRADENVKIQIIREND